MSKATQRNIKIIVMLLLMTCFGFIPAIDPITPVGMRTLGVFLGMLFGWVFIEVGAPSILALVFMGLFSASNMTAVLQGSMGHQVISLLIAILFLAAFIDQTGLGKVIVYRLLHLKIVKGRPLVFIFILEFSALLMTTLGSGYATIVIMIALAKEINSILKYEVGSRQLTAILVGVVLGSIMAEVILPIKAGPVIYAGVVADIYTVNFLNYCLCSIPLVLLNLALYPLFCKYIMRIDFSELSTISEHFYNQPAEAFAKEQKRALYVAITFLAALLLTALPFKWAWLVKLQSLGMGGLGLIVLGFMWLLRIDGQPIMDIRGLTKNFNFQPIFMAAAVLFTISALTTDETGIKTAISQLLGPLLADKSAMVVMIFLIVLAGILTEFMNNSVIAALLLATGALLSQSIPGINIGALVLAIPLAAYSSVAMPSANACCAMVFAENDLVTPKSMMIQGWATVCFILVLICIELPYINWLM